MILYVVQADEPTFSEVKDLMHLYDESKELELINTIIERYIPAFQQLKDGLDARYGEMLLAQD